MHLPKHLAIILHWILLIVVTISFLLPTAPLIPSYADDTSYVSANGTALSLHGKPYQFTGVNAYNIATLPGTNAGCGGYIADLDGFFSNLRPNSMVRLWAFQGSITTNTETKKTDWAGLDRVVNSAEKNGIKLILVLGDQSGTCDDGHWKDKAWYDTGYTQVVNDYGNGLTPLPYLEHVKQVISRYKNNPSVAMWEPINEPEAADCTSGKGYECYAKLICQDEQAAATILRKFFDTVGGTIKSIDSKHLISSGMIGDGQCGTVYESYKYVHQSPGIDVGSFHDYNRDDQPIPGDEWNGLKKRLVQLSSINKPLIIGEVGMLARDNTTGCMNYSTRKDKMKAKMDAQFATGVAGFLPWSFTNGTPSGCNYDVVRNDPIINLLREYPVSMSDVIPASSITPFPTPTPLAIDRVSPNAPTGLTVNLISTTQATLRWNVATDNVGVTKYDIFRNGNYLTSTSSTSFSNSGLTPSTTYVFHVKAKDAAGNNSGESNKASLVTSFITPTATRTPSPTPTTVPDKQNPTAPSNLSANNQTRNQITLSWKPATDNVGVTRYDIFRNDAYLTSTSSTTFTNSNLQSMSIYTYHVKAKDAASNNSAASNKVTVTVQ